MNAKTRLTKALQVHRRRVWVVKLVEEALDYVRSVGSGVQTELTSWTHSILVHLTREDKWVFDQRHHPEAVSLNGKSWPPATSYVTVPLPVPSPHTSAKTLSLAVPKPTHQSKDVPLQVQLAAGPLAYGDPGWLAKSPSL